MDNEKDTFYKRGFLGAVFALGCGVVGLWLMFKGIKGIFAILF